MRERAGSRGSQTAARLTSSPALFPGRFAVCVNSLFLPAPLALAADVQHGCNTGHAHSTADTPPARCEHRDSPRPPPLPVLHPQGGASRRPPHMLGPKCTRVSPREHRGDGCEPLRRGASPSRRMVMAFGRCRDGRLCPAVLEVRSPWRKPLGTSGRGHCGLRG